MPFDLIELEVDELAKDSKDALEVKLELGLEAEFELADLICELEVKTEVVDEFCEPEDDLSAEFETKLEDELLELFELLELLELLEELKLESEQSFD